MNDEKQSNALPNGNCILTGLWPKEGPFVSDAEEGASMDGGALRLEPTEMPAQSAEENPGKLPCCMMVKFGIG